jgi:coproporphyrinogen III oxidase
MASRRRWRWFSSDSKWKCLWKGGVNISAVHGAPAAMQNYFSVPEADFYTTGISLVIHWIYGANSTCKFPGILKCMISLGRWWIALVRWWTGFDMTPVSFLKMMRRHFHQFVKKFTSPAK